MRCFRPLNCDSHLEPALSWNLWSKKTGLSSKHEMLIQCWFNVVLSTSIGSTSLVCWVNYSLKQFSQNCRNGYRGSTFFSSLSQTFINQTNHKDRQNHKRQQSLTQRPTKPQTSAKLDTRPTKPQASAVPDTDANQPTNVSSA